MVFECDCQLYEIMLTACTPKEEDEWRSRMELNSATTPQEQGAPAFGSSLYLNLKSLGTVFGKQGEHVVLSGVSHTDFLKALWLAIFQFTEQQRLAQSRPYAT